MLELSHTSLQLLSEFVNAYNRYAELDQDMGASPVDTQDALNAFFDKACHLAANLNDEHPLTDDFEF